jgi:multidrug efflux system membrane fusion protein
MKRSSWILLISAALAILVGYFFFSPWPATKSEARSRRGRAAREAVPVAVASVVQKNIPIQLRAVGTVEAYSTVSVKPQVTGTLTRAHFKEGQDVRKGDLLFTIDTRPFETALRQAESNLAKDIAQLENARAQLLRYEELLRKQFVSREQYDQIRASASALEATAEANRAAVETARLQLSYATIRSPMDGRTGSLLSHEGNLVRVNDNTALVVINQIQPITVTFAVPEQFLADIKSRLESGRVRVEASRPQADGRPEQGLLTFVDNSVDKTAGTIRLKGTFANEKRDLWPGQFVDVVVTLAERPNALVVPTQAVQTGQDGQYLFVVTDNRKVEMRPVVVAMTHAGETVLQKGVQSGEVVVIDGHFRLAPGSEVEVKQGGRPE